MALYTLGNFRPELPDDGSAWVAPSASLIGNVKLETGASVWFNSVLRGDNELIHVGSNSNVQDGSVLHTDPGFPLTLGAHVTVGHMTMLHGCIVGDGSLIGMSSTILNGTRIGRNCLIGANSFLAQGKDIPDNSLVIGAPGKVVRTLTDDEVMSLKASAEVYVRNGARYRDELTVIT